MKPNFTNGQSVNAADIVKDIIFMSFSEESRLMPFWSY